jgi:2-polyprenyl-6-hydroxyphenyl methylase/3-demethylubiquinone-9 3-methyltransferase
LPFADGAFDVVLSCVGAMFAPRHRTTADELVRVCAPGGTIGMVNWTREGFIGHLFATLGPFAPPPPPGAQPPPLWGDEAHVRDLFGDRVAALDMRRRQVVFDRCADPEEFREYWKRNYGPTIAVYAFNAADPIRVAALDAAFLEFLTAWNRDGRYEAEYLLITGRRAA